jgi:hypothetical protein
LETKVSTCNRDLKPEDAAKQRREIEAETKVRRRGDNQQNQLFHQQKIREFGHQLRHSQS